MTRKIPQYVATKATAKGTFLKTKRRGVPAVLAERVFARDGGKCVGCGEDRHARLCLDHILPVALGGDNTLGNLQTLCQGCNAYKAYHMTPAAMHKAHPEVKLTDLDYTHSFSTGRPGAVRSIKWTDTITPIKIVADLRSVLVPARFHREILALIDHLRSNEEQSPAKTGTDG